MVVECWISHGPLHDPDFAPFQVAGCWSAMLTRSAPLRGQRLYDPDRARPRGAAVAPAVRRIPSENRRRRLWGGPPGVVRLKPPLARRPRRHRENPRPRPLRIATPRHVRHRPQKPEISPVPSADVRHVHVWNPSQGGGTGSNPVGGTAAKALSCGVSTVQRHQEHPDADTRENIRESSRDFGIWSLGRRSEPEIRRCLVPPPWCAATPFQVAA